MCQELVQSVGDQLAAGFQEVGVAVHGVEGPVGWDALQAEVVGAEFGQQVGQVLGGGLVADAAVGAAADAGEVGTLLLAMPGRR